MWSHDKYIILPLRLDVKIFSGLTVYIIHVCNSWSYIYISIVEVWIMFLYECWELSPMYIYIYTYMYTPTYLPTYLPAYYTYLPTYPPTLPTNLPTYLPTYLPT